MTLAVGVKCVVADFIITAIQYLTGSVHGTLSNIISSKTTAMEYYNNWAFTIILKTGFLYSIQSNRYWDPQPTKKGINFPSGKINQSMNNILT